MSLAAQGVSPFVTLLLLSLTARMCFAQDYCETWTKKPFQSMCLERPSTNQNLGDIWQSKTLWDRTFTVDQKSARERAYFSSQQHESQVSSEELSRATAVRGYVKVPAHLAQEAGVAFQKDAMVKLIPQGTGTSYYIDLSVLRRIMYRERFRSQQEVV